MRIVFFVFRPISRIDNLTEDHESFVKKRSEFNRMSRAKRSQIQRKPSFLESLNRLANR